MDNCLSEIKGLNKSVIKKLQEMYLLHTGLVRWLNPEAI